MKRAHPYSPIKKQRHTAEKVGKIIAEYAFLEYILAQIYCALCSEHPETAIKTFYSKRSLNKQKQLLTQTAKSWESEAFTIPVKRLLRRMSNASDKRTEVAHCIFVGNSDQMMRLVFTQDGPEFEPFTHETYIEIMQQFQTLADDLLTFLSVLGRHPAILHRINHAINLSKFPGTVPEPKDNPPRPRITKESEIIASLHRLGLVHDPNQN